MNRRAGLLIGAGVAALLCPLGLYLFLKAVPYQETIDHGPSPEAQANPYLAAEHFLRRQGINVEHATNLDVLPSLEPDTRSLMLLADRTDMTTMEIDQLLTWASD